jgi:muramoyltetrapeptide carboxypeptidase
LRLAAQNGREFSRPFLLVPNALQKIYATRMQINLLRRRWLCAIAAGASMAALPMAQAAPRRPPQKRLFPPALKRGDLVALFNPSGVADDALIERATTNLEKLGFRVLHAAHLRASRGNTAGTIGQRLTDFHALIKHREVRALWAARGGSGTAQLLPYIDYGLVARHPKVVIGYSDITALLLALYAKTGLVGFHGPVASSGFTPFTVSQLEATLIEGRANHPMRTADEHAQRALQEPHFVQRVIRGGSAEGILLGGNLSVMSAMIGTPYLPNLRDALLFLEEISEAPYRIDRMLTQFEQSGNLAGIRSALLGVFVKCEPVPGEESLVLSQALNDHFAARPTPSAYGLSFGHIASQWVLPVGVKARFDADARTLTLLESPVSNTVTA